jgi:pyruvate,orthophosphate dikinase
MPKDRMIAALGEDHLLLPGLVASALTANDRVKYLLTLLQTARAAADGAVGATSLGDERLACGVDDVGLDRVVGESAREPDGWYRIPGAEGIARQAIDEVQGMLAPLNAAGVPAERDLGRRIAAVSTALSLEGDLADSEDIARLTAGRGGDGDSLHLVVMDAHRELNALEARIATESIDGAHVHDLAPGDRGLVRAFMRGVRRTERLRLDHPGLGTIATRTGSALVLQNDLGTTDAHVVVIRVAGRVVTITYTDIHLARLLFFQDLLASWRIAWEDTRSRSDKAIEGGLYHLASARFEAGDDAELERFMEDLGSRLVFIIDWNRARKRLRRLVGRRAAIELLRWTAEHGYGHIAFLRAGADGLVYEALEFAGGRVARAGESLQDVLGTQAAEEYLQAVLRICSEGLLAGKMVSLVQDEVRAELTGYLRSARQEIHALALYHAELSVEIVEAARDGLERAIVGAEDRRHAAAARAQSAEHEADALVTEVRNAVARAPDLGPFLEIVEAADDIADCAEEAAFYTTLLPAGHPAGGVRPQVRRIARLVLAASREYLRAVLLSVELRRGGPREEMDAFLGAAYRAIALERETDDAQRAIHQALVAEAEESGVALFVVVELTRAFEEAADALMHSAHLLREHALARVVRSDSSARRAPEPAPAPAPSVAPVVTGEHVYVVGDPSLPVPDASTIGAKAHGLARIARAGLRVPEAAVLKTSFAHSRMRSQADDEHLREVLAGAVDALEAWTGLRLVSPRRPLLLSVRSGAPVSMPGMLETVLNVGLCEVSARGLIALTGNPRLAWDSYRRFVESFAAVVHGCPREPFEQAVRERLGAADVQSPRELTARMLEDLTRAHLERFADLTGEQFPQDPLEQLVAAVGAVLASWDAPKARDYRRLHEIPDDLGTAVILQRMVFGNAGGVSGAGVGFTRDPALGERRLYMDFLLDAQGEDIVSGRQAVDGSSELAVIAPDLLAEIEQVRPRLEAEFGDAQEFELTVQEGELFLLQTRTAKRTPWAALRIATDQVHEGLISPETALTRLDDLDLEAIRRVHVDAPEGTEALCHAIPASVGVATGPLALDRDAADRFARTGTAPVLVRSHAVTEDVVAVAVSAGVLTGTGGRTSHAAVVARELGKPCLVGCSELELDLDARTALIGGRLLAEGDVICLDAESGLVFPGAPAVIEERPTEELGEVAAWRVALSAANDAGK